MIIESPYLDISTLSNCLKELSEIKFDGKLILVKLPAGLFDHRTGTVFNYKDDIHDHLSCLPYVVGFKPYDETSLQQYFNDNIGYTLFMQPNYPSDTIYHDVNHDYIKMKNFPLDGKCVRMSRIKNI